MYLLAYLDVQGGEVAVEVFGVIDVRLPTDWTHHVSDVFVPYSDGKVLLKTTTAHRALTRRERLHLRREGGRKQKIKRWKSFRKIFSDPKASVK